MRVKSNVRAGGIGWNHNQTTAGVRIKSSVKAGGRGLNHSQAVKGLRVKSSVRAGGAAWNHSQTVKVPGGRARAGILSAGLLLAASLLLATPQAWPARGGPFSASAASAAREGPVSWTFTTVDFPGFASVTAPIDMNNHGDMVGYYDDQAGAFHGYLKLKDGPFIPLDFPGSVATATVGISDNREVVGVYFDQAGFQHGFLLKDGVYTTIDVPGAAQTRGVMFEFGGGLGTAAFGINAVRDLVLVGEYADENKVAHGFLLRDGQFTTIDAPDAPQLPGTESMAVRVNSHGDIVGSVNVAAFRQSRGFLLKDGQYTTVEHPESGGYFGTVAVGLNDQGDVAGSFTGSSSANDFHGFALIQGQYYTIDFPGAAYTETYNINNNQTVVGGYKGSDRRMHGYVGVRND